MFTSLYEHAQKIFYWFSSVPYPMATEISRISFRSKELLHLPLPAWRLSRMNVILNFPYTSDTATE